MLARVQVFEVLHDHSGLVGTPRWTMTDGRYKATRIDIQERLRFLVGVYFDVLVGNGFMFEGYPNTLDKGACIYQHIFLKSIRKREREMTRTRSSFRIA